MSDKRIVERISNSENKYVAKEFKTIQEISKDHFYEFVNGEKVYTTVKKIKTLDRVKNYMISHENVEYNDKKYTVCLTKYNDKDILFVVDFEDRDKVIDRLWNIFYPPSSSTYYIRCSKNVNKNQSIYLHSIVMDNNFDDTKLSVVHINKDPRDNRKANLRLTETVDKNQKRVYSKVLPFESDIKDDEIPKNITCERKDANHDYQFVINMKNIDELHALNYLGNQSKKYCLTVYTTSEKRFSYRFKFEQAKKYLNYLFRLFPSLYENRYILNDYTEEDLKLIKEYNEILDKTTFECKHANKINVDNIILKKQFPANYDKLSDEEKSILINYLNFDDEQIKKYQRILGIIDRDDNFVVPSTEVIRDILIPEKVEELAKKITIDGRSFVIPYEYVKYTKKSIVKGDYFTILKNHPQIIKKYGGKDKSTETTPKRTIEYKYVQLLDMLKVMNIDLTDEDEKFYDKFKSHNLINYEINQETLQIIKHKEPIESSGASEQKDDMPSGQSCENNSAGEEKEKHTTHITPAISAKLTTLETPKTPITLTPTVKDKNEKNDKKNKKMQFRLREPTEQTEDKPVEQTDAHYLGNVIDDKKKKKKKTIINSSSNYNIDEMITN